MPIANVSKTVSLPSDVPEVKHVAGFTANVSVVKILEALGDSPRSYAMGQGENAGHSHRRVAWLGDGIDTPYVTIHISFQLFPG